jgi:tetratricopeptide (TPR) repeat protein
MRKTTLFSTLLCLLLVLAAGCAGIQLPRTITEGDVTPQRKKRNEECVRQFDQQRDFAEFEAAKARWVQQRDLKGCREALEKLLARRPQHRDARLLMVELLLAAEDPPGAYRQAKAALDAHPNDAEVQYTMALALDAQGKTADALAYYERATKMDPRNESFAASYQTAREAAHEEMGAAKAAVFEGNDAVDDLAAEGLPVGYAETAAPAPRAGRTGSPGRAGSTASSEVAVDGPAGELLRKGRAALAEGSSQAAVENFRQAAATKPDNPQIPISAAAVALRANRPEVAVEVLASAAKRFPNSPAVHRMLGAAYYRTGDYKSSQVALQQALSLDKSSALSYLLMGCTLAKLGQNEAAESHFRQARTLDPKYKVVR